MNRFRSLLVFTMSLCIVALLAACGGSSTGTGDTGTPAASTAAGTTPTARPKPTSIPHFTVDSCNHLMSLDEAQSIFSPPAAPTTIVPTNGDTGGACNYDVSKTNIPLVIYFFTWNGPVPIPDSAVQAALSQSAGANLTINTA